jgi:hypothetical protein
MNSPAALAWLAERCDLDCALVAGRYTLLDRSAAEVLFSAGDLGYAELLVLPPGAPDHHEGRILHANPRRYAAWAWTTEFWRINVTTGVTGDCIAMFCRGARAGDSYDAPGRLISSLTMRIIFPRPGRQRRQSGQSEHSVPRR